jgi:adenomatosis polyposis coli protein
VMSFTSSTGLLPDEVAATRRTYSQQQLGAKVEMVYSLLSMLGTHDREDMSRTLLAMSSSPDSCVAKRQSGRLELTQDRTGHHIHEAVTISKAKLFSCTVL